MAYLQCLFALLALAATLQNSEALRCWSCSSDVAPCADYFNASQYTYSYRTDPRQSFPRLEDCNQLQTPYYPLNQRAVCMKKKMIVGRDERVNYIRSCQFISGDITVGTCPKETTSSSMRVDFCEYCDYDGCNGASTMEKSAMLALLVPAVLFFYLRK